MRGFWKYFGAVAAASLALSGLGAILGWIIFKITIYSGRGSEFWVPMLSFCIGVILAREIIITVVALQPFRKS